VLDLGDMLMRFTQDMTNFGDAIFELHNFDLADDGIDEPAVRTLRPRVAILIQVAYDYVCFL
jgi:hypothetical protein